MMKGLIRTRRLWTCTYRIPTIPCYTLLHNSIIIYKVFKYTRKGQITDKFNIYYTYEYMRMILALVHLQTFI